MLNNEAPDFLYLSIILSFLSILWELVLRGISSIFKFLYLIKPLIYV